LANVSIGTVDRVLHNRTGVAEETKQKVLKIIEELDYKPNIIARRLVSKKKYTLAVLIPAPTKDNPYWNLHVLGIKKAEDEIKQLGIFIEKLSYDQSDPASYIQEANKIIQGNYDGILMVPFFKEETIKLLDHCESNNIPCVFFDTNLQSSSFNPLSYIGQNAFKSGYFAASVMSYILNPNDTALAVSINAVKKADNHVNYLQREEGFKKFVTEKNSFKLELFHFNNQDEHESELLEKEILLTLKKNSTIQSVFVTNSRAYKLAAILEKNNINHLTLIGYDLMEPNIHYLKNGYIDFLISQEPQNQGYSGIMTLFNHLILNQEAVKENLAPITLISKDNLEFYQG
jgi:LacI family transcriptional regulator